MSTPPTIRCTVMARVGTDRAALVVRLPDGAGPAWAPGTQVLLTLLLPDVDQSGSVPCTQRKSVSRVDPSGLPGGGDPSGAVVELPDDAVLGRLVEAASPIDLLPPVLARVPAAVERVNALRRTRIANGRMREDSQTNDDLGVVTLAATWAENGAIAAPAVRAEAVGAAAGPVSVGVVRDAAAAMVRWCDDPTASPTVLGSILAPLVPAVRAEAVADERVAVVHDAETAWIPLDELGDWTELAEAFDARVETSGDPSGEYTSVLCWPDGRRAYARDRLAIISYDAELPSPAEQLAAAGMGPVATPTEPAPAAHLPSCRRPGPLCLKRQCRCWCHYPSASPVPAEQPPDVIEVTRLGYSAGQEAEHG